VEPSGIEPLTSTLPVFKLKTAKAPILKDFFGFFSQKFCTFSKYLKVAEKLLSRGVLGVAANA